jgi:hypothetical protein
LEKLGLTTESRAADWDTDGDGIPNWFEELTGTNASAANNNDDRDGDYYTDLEEYLNWMAVPNFRIEGAQTIDLKDYFAGYKSPSYVVTTASGVTAQEQNGTLTVTPSATAGKLFTIQVKAIEDGMSLERVLHFAYGSGTNGIQALTTQDAEGEKVCYDLQGRRVASPTKRGVYIQNGRKFIVR